MNKNLGKKIFFIPFNVLILSCFALPFQGNTQTERGTLSIYFREENVGYEDYSWEAGDQGYTLSVSGRMTQPIALEIESLRLSLNRDFIPLEFSFKGSVTGVPQEVTSSITEGKVEYSVRVSGQETKIPAEIKRDAFLLPNPIFSPYIVLAKKFKCTLQEKVELSAHIVPQLEAPFTLEPKKDQPCSLLINMSGINIELRTNENGDLLLLSIPSQNLKITRE
jgi:hypothetical protein